MIQTIKKKWKLVSVLGIGIILAGVAGWKYTQSSQASTDLQTATISVSKGPIKVTISGSGSVQPAETKTIVSKVSGPISAIYVKNGQHVDEGDQLFTINSDSAKTEITKAELELKQAKADYNAALQQSTQAAQQSTQQTTPNLDQGNNSGNSAATTTTTRTASTSSNKESLKIKVELAQLNLTNLNKQLADYKIYAPTDGIVNLSSSQSLGSSKSSSSSSALSASASSSSSSSTTTQWSVGDQVSSNSTLATMIGDAGMNVTISVDEVDISKVKVGQKVDITADAMPDKKFTGKVLEIATEGTSSNGVASFDVLIGIDKPVGLKIGMTANAEINVANKDNVLLLPIEAVQERGNRKFVMLPNTDGGDTKTGTSASPETRGFNQSGTPKQNNFSQRGNMKVVETGLYNESLIEITSGLQEGEQVIIPTVTRTNTNANRTGMPFGGGGGMRASGGGFGGGR